MHPLLAGGSISKETFDMMKGALGGSQDNLGKTVTVSTGLVAYDLQAPAKMLYPTITPIRNVLPRVRRQNPGDAAHWKKITAITGSGWDAMGWVPEGQRSARMSYQAEDMAFAYRTMGEEDALTFEAEAAAQGFEDENAMVTFRLLQKMMRKEEMALLGGNATLALGTPATPTLAAGGTGKTLPTATYSVIVVALSFEGYMNSSVANGVATSKVITGADGQTFTLNGGSSNKSAAATQAITIGEELRCSVAPVRGAVAYAWYVGLAGAEKLEAITSRAQAVFSAPLAGTGQAATAITGDMSRNANYSFDGLLTNAFTAANNAYVRWLDNTSDGTGTGLTASGRGSCVEIDTMLQTMWDNYRLGPSVIWVNSQEQKNITTTVLSGGTNAPLLRYEAPTTPGQAYGLVAGGVIDYYYNPFSVDGGYKIPVKIHPDLPPGTIACWCEKLPPWYQSNSVPNVAEVLLRRDYYRMDWPLRTRMREYGVYAEEVLGVYAPFAMGIISNIANKTS